MDVQTSQPDSMGHITLLPNISYIIAMDTPNTFTSAVTPEYPVNPNGSFAAATCSLELCVQQLDISVRESVYSESQKRVSCNGTYPPADFNGQNLSSPLYIYNLSNPYNDELYQQTFAVNGTAFTTISWFLHGLFRGSVHAGISDDSSSNSFSVGPKSTDGTNYATADILQSIWYGNLSGCGLEDDRLTCAFNNTAAAITKSLRDSAFVMQGVRMDSQAANIQNPIHDSLAFGIIWNTRTYVRISWYWLILPVLVWVLSVVTWLGTAWKTRRAKVPSWDNNPLPLLFLRQPQTRQRFAPENEVSNDGCEVWASNIDAQLHVEKRKAFLL